MELQVQNIPEFVQEPGGGSASVEPQQPPGTAVKLEVNAPLKVSCCYGFIVFLGLAVSLLTLTMIVIWAGVWSQHTLYGKLLT